MVLLQEFGRGLYVTLDELIEDARFRDSSVYFVGELGPVRRRLATLPHYVESRYVDGAEPGLDLGDRTTSQDLQRLTFADESFDLVISSHVMEHVPNPWRALEEVRRVLRPGGRYIFSIPFRGPPLSDTVARAVLEDGEVRHLVEPAYHNSPQGPSLVFHDFGADLVDRGNACGLLVRILRPHMAMQVAFRDVVVVATRLPPNGL